MISVLWIALGGGLGALLRYGAMGIFPSHPLPYDIFIINISGSFLIAVVMTLSLEYGWLSPRIRLFLTVGVLGGYTTFSTFMLGIEQLITHHQLLPAYTYAIGSLFLGLLACWVGVVGVRLFIHRLTGQSPEPDPPLESIEDEVL